jgi:hypothetical protein
MKTVTFKKIMGGLIIALVLLITIRYVKMLPAIMKLLAIGANVATIYLTYNWFIKQKKKKEKNGN